eukprot:4133212-Lingulodinium_polyedra.AAC.1
MPPPTPGFARASGSGRGAAPRRRRAGVRPAPNSPGRTGRPRTLKRTRPSSWRAGCGAYAPRWAA